MTLPCYTFIDCHWLLFLRDLHSSLAAIAVIFTKRQCRPWLGYSVWDAAGFDAFEPRRVFAPKRPEKPGGGWGSFIVVQSRSGIEPAQVWGRVAPYLN